MRTQQRRSMSKAFLVMLHVTMHASGMTPFSIVSIQFMNLMQIVAWNGTSSEGSEPTHLHTRFGSHLLNWFQCKWLFGMPPSQKVQDRPMPLLFWAPSQKQEIPAWDGGCGGEVGGYLLGHLCSHDLLTRPQHPVESQGLIPWDPTFPFFTLNVPI